MLSLPPFPVHRIPSVLVAPAESTPREQKILSDIDNQQVLHAQIHVLLFFRYDPTSPGASQNPGTTIRNVIFKALVLYYPLAGRLRDGGDGQKLVVDCTGEGVLFTEAEADIPLEQLGHRVLPPFPYRKEVINDVEGSSGIPLLIQVTHLACGGFILGFRVNHVMCDAIGFMQFLQAVSELARGAAMPSVVPVWKRDLLKIKITKQPRIVETCLAPSYDKDAQEENAVRLLMLENESRSISRAFFFGHAELANLRKQLPRHLQSLPSTFEILSACFWRWRTVALGLDPDTLVRLMFPVDVRSRMKPSIPTGYYGNCLAFAEAVCTVADLCSNSLQHAVELVRMAKSKVTNEPMRVHGEFLTGMATGTVYIASNLMHVGFDRVDFGWGRPVYGGTADAGFYYSLFVPIRNRDGEFEGLSVEMKLPAPAMDRLVTEIKQTITDVPRLCKI